MELHEGDALWRPGQMVSKLLRDVGLAGARRALEDDLLLVGEEGVDFVEEVGGFGEEKPVGELVQVRGSLTRGIVSRFLFS